MVQQVQQHKTMVMAQQQAAAASTDGTDKGLSMTEQYARVSTLCWDLRVFYFLKTMFLV
jgi:hypothetical protein